jgi:hypothetical protein
VAESTVRWFVVREKHCWMTADLADKLKRTRRAFFFTSHLTSNTIERFLYFFLDDELGHIRLSYNPYFSTCFFSRNRVFLSQQISEQYSQSWLFSEANRLSVLLDHNTNSYLSIFEFSPLLFTYKEK